MGFETSESYIAPRPVYTVALSEGECALATPPYANLDHTHIILAKIDNLLALSVDKDEDPFWRGDSLRDYRFDKNAALGPLFPMTMPRLTMGGGGLSLPILTLDDSNVINFLAGRGVREIPVAVRVLDAGPISYAAQTLGGENARAPKLDALLRARTDHDVTGTKFTTFLPVEELEKFINTRLCDFYGSLRSFWDGNEHTEYREFMKAAALLDELIAHGAHGAWVKNPNNVFAVTEGLRDILGQGDMSAVRELKPMEWVDRFERLYERRMHYRDHPMRDADVPALERVNALARPAAEMIAASEEALMLAKREMSDQARIYLSALLPAAKDNRRSFPNWLLRTVSFSADR